MLGDRKSGPQCLYWQSTGFFAKPNEFLKSLPLRASCIAGLQVSISLNSSIATVASSGKSGKAQLAPLQAHEVLVLHAVMQLVRTLDVSSHARTITGR